MSSGLSYLQSVEKAAIHDCVIRLRAALGDALTALWLFGSKARGDSAPDSDIDVLVVLRSLQPERRWRIREISAECSLEFDVLFNTHIVEKRRWNEEVRYRGTLWREIQRDGVSLLPEAVLAEG